MLFAIIVAIITFIVATAAVAAFFVLRARRAGTVAKPSHAGRDRVRSVDNVGVKGTLDEQVRARGGKHTTPTTAPAETTAVTVDSAQGSGTDFAPETAQITTTAQTTTVTTTTLMTTTAVTTTDSLPETTTALYSEDEEPKKSWLPAAALGLIAAGCGGLLCFVRLIRKQDSGAD